MPGLHVDVIHVFGRRANIFGGYVAAAQTLHEAAVRAEESFTVFRLVVADYYRLAAAQTQPRDCILVGHPARQPQSIDDRLLVAIVGPEPRTSQSGAESCAVNRDYPAVPGRGI